MRLLFTAMKNIYLDNAATTRVDDAVFSAMEPYLKDMYGNPSASYSLAAKSKKAVGTAREQVARLINAEPSEIYFTSGGTESDNMALNGFYELIRDKGCSLITTKVEHHAVLRTAEALERRGLKTVYAPLTECGCVDVPALDSMDLASVGMASIMTANNEIGAINDITAVADIFNKRGILFHTDAVQAVGHERIDVRSLKIDSLSASAHKFHGPKGVGFLFIRNTVKIPPFIIGGGQEGGLRSGTENVAGIVGMGVASHIAYESLEKDRHRIITLRDRLIDRILREIPYSILNGPKESDSRLCNNADFSFAHINGASLVIQLDMKGVCASTGSACSASDRGASHVLSAIGVPVEYSDGSLRLTLSKFTTLEEIDYAVEVIKSSVAFLRQITD